MFSLKMACIAGPAVAVTETTAALVTETISTVHAKTSAEKGGPGATSFGAVLKETITPSYAGRCWTSLLIKNVGANTPLFWIMFMSDFYAKKHKLVYER